MHIITQYHSREVGQTNWSGGIESHWGAASIQHLERHATRGFKPGKFEILAVTTDLDTQTTTYKTLMFNKIESITEVAACQQK